MSSIDSLLVKAACEEHALLSRMCREEDWEGAYRVVSISTPENFASLCLERVSDYENADSTGEDDLIAAARRLGDRLSRGLFVRGFGIDSLDDWIPKSLPNPDNWHGVDRLAHPRLLAGQTLSAVGVPIEVAIIEADEMSAPLAHGGPVYVSPSDFRMLANRGSTRVYVVNDNEAVVHRDQGGHVRVLSDTHCPVGTGWYVPMSVFALASLRSSPHQVEDRPMVAFYGNTVMYAPASCVRIDGLCE